MTFPTLGKFFLGGLTVAALGVAGVVGDRELSGLGNRLAEIEGRLARVPRERAALEQALETVQTEIGAIRRDLEEARANGVEATELADRLSGAESQLSSISGAIEAHKSSLAVLEEATSSFGPDTLEARIAERDRELSHIWEALGERVERAEETADESRQRLEELGRELDQPERDVVRMWDELVGPTVQLAGENSVGSGVLLRSRPTDDDEVFDTYILTAWHVVRDIVEGDYEMSVPVSIYLSSGRVQAETATLLDHEAEVDVALLRLDVDRALNQGTVLAPRSAIDAKRIFDRVYAVGCPLGNDPIPTPGEISTLSHGVDGVNYWMINAPTYIGNSGGGIFDAETHALLGIFSKIYTHGALRPTIVPHMGLVTPLGTVYDWLDEAGWSELIPEGPSDSVAGI